MRAHARAQGRRDRGGQGASLHRTPHRQDRVRPERSRSRLAKNHDLDHDLDWLRVGPSARVLSGTRKKGTHVPTLVAIDDANKQRWRVEVPIDSLAADEGPAGQVVVGADAVCAAYELTADKNKMAVTCFSATDGARLWNEPISSHYASSLLISGDVVLVSMSHVLEARDLKSGVVRWRFGE